MIHKESWTYRCKCGSCGAVLWTPVSEKTVCVCSGCHINADGTLSNNTLSVTDEEMIQFIKQDWGLDEVSVEYVSE